MPKRERRRYLALEVQREQPLDGRTLADAVEASVKRLFGEYGASHANLKLIKYVTEKNQYVIRCNHKAVEQVRAAIASIIEINEKIAAVHVVGVSGTLKALYKKT